MHLHSAARFYLHKTISRYASSARSNRRAPSAVQKNPNQLPAIFVSCALGAEPLLQRELQGLGYENTAKNRGVLISKVPKSTMAALYNINYRSRLATRVLLNIASFPVTSADELYENLTKNIDFTSYFGLQHTFRVDTIMAESDRDQNTNTLFYSKRAKDAIVDQFNTKFHSRPDVDLKSNGEIIEHEEESKGEASADKMRRDRSRLEVVEKRSRRQRTNHFDVRVNVAIARRNAVVSIDTSAEPLFRRGYRQSQVHAALQETIAAILLHKAKYGDGGEYETLCDPFCGSGTFLIEAALMRTNTPPQFNRQRFGFHTLPEYDDREWASVRLEANANIIPLPKGVIMGSDIDQSAVDITRENLKVFGFDRQVSLSVSHIAHYKPSPSPQLVVTNPPYGIRVGEHLSILYSDIGKFLKTQLAPKGRAFLLSTKENFSSLGLRYTDRGTFNNGGIMTSFVEVDINTDSKKTEK